LTKIVDEKGPFKERTYFKKNTTDGKIETLDERAVRSSSKQVERRIRDAEGKRHA